MRRFNWLVVLSLVVLSVLPVGQPHLGYAAEPAAKTVVQAGDLRLTLDRSGDGIRVLSLADAAKGVELLAAKPLPLFSMVLRHVPDKKEVLLDAATGWEKVRGIRGGGLSGGGLALVWQQAKDARLKDIQVTVVVAEDATGHAFRWKLEVQNKSPEWTVWRVVFPQIAVADLGSGASVFLPRGPGEVQRAVWQRAFQFRGTYPGGVDDHAVHGGLRPGPEHRPLLRRARPAGQHQGHGRGEPAGRQGGRASASSIRRPTWACRATASPPMARRSGSSCAATGSTRP